MNELGFMFGCIAIATFDFVAGIALLNITKENETSTVHYISLKERNRRLVPYTTFYINGDNQYNNRLLVNREKSQKSHFVPGKSYQPIRQKTNYIYNYQNLPRYKYVTPDQVLRNQNYDVQYQQTPQQFESVTDYQKLHFVSSPANQYSTVSPNYLKFRYSDVKVSTDNYYPTSTPATIEITSPKQHYLTTVTPTTSVMTYESHEINNALNQDVEPIVEYPNYAFLSQTQNVPNFTPIQKYPEPEKKTVTTMSIMKSQEIQLEPKEKFQIPKQSYKSYQRPVYIHQHAAKVQHHQLPSTDILNGYELSKQLPDRITPDNIKESIHALTYILQMLQKADSISQLRTSVYSKGVLDSLKESPSLLSPDDSGSPLNGANLDYNLYNEHENYVPQKYTYQQPAKEADGTPGRPGIDYPIYSITPHTSFSCKDQRYKGFFADPETNCQVWHYCDLNGGQASFLCPNGTLFSQAALTCDWWFNVKCSTTTQLYVLNERLYKYIIPARPSFPEDFSGPLVDQYLTEKFKETESKRKYRYPNNSTSTENHQNNTTSTDY